MAEIAYVRLIATCGRDLQCFSVATIITIDMYLTVMVQGTIEESIASPRSPYRLYVYARQ